MARKQGKQGRNEQRGRRMYSFVIGGLLGASAAAAARRRLRPRPKRRETPAGLGAFESAPCYRELAERRRSDGP